MWTRICYGKKDMPFNYSEFICDSEDDLDSLPTNKKPSNNNSLITPCSIGSQAIIVEPRKKYILNGNNEWLLIENYTTTTINTDTSSLDIASLDEVENYLGI